MENKIYIWIEKIPSWINRTNTFQSFLSQEEKGRIEKLFFERDKQQYLISHGLMRIVLSQYSGIKPGDLKFKMNKYGKPKLVNKGCEELNFNISHSKEYFSMAISNYCDLGIDIEFKSEISEIDDVINNFFSDREIEAFKSIDQEIKLEAFFACWTRKEAFIKAQGKGLYFGLDKFSVSIDPFEPPILFYPEDRISQVWKIFDLKLQDDNFRAALVANANNSEIDYPEIDYPEI